SRGWLPPRPGRNPWAVPAGQPFPPHRIKEPARAEKKGKQVLSWILGLFLLKVLTNTLILKRIVFTCKGQVFKNKFLGLTHQVWPPCGREDNPSPYPLASFPGLGEDNLEL